MSGYSSRITRIATKFDCMSLNHDHHSVMMCNSQERCCGSAETLNILSNLIILLCLGQCFCVRLWGVRLYLANLLTSCNSCCNFSQFLSQSARPVSSYHCSNKKCWPNTDPQCSAISQVSSWLLLFQPDAFVQNCHADRHILPGHGGPC